MARRRGKKSAFAAREFIGDTGGDYGLGGSLGGTADDGGSSWDTGGSQLDGGSGGWGFDGGGYAGDGTDNGYGDTGSGWGGLGMGGGGFDNGDGNYNSGIGYGGYGSDLSGGMALGGFSPTDGRVSIQEAMARWYANPANQPQAPAAPQGVFGPRMGVGTGYLSAPSGLSSPLKMGALSQMYNSQPEQKIQDQVPQDQYGVMSGTVPDAMPNVPQSAVMARNPYDVSMGRPSPADAAGQIGGATFGGFAAMPGQVPGIANQTVYKSPDIPSGIGQTPTQSPFGQYANQGLPPGYADAYGIGMPSTMIAGDPRVNMAPGAYQNTQDIMMASGDPVNGPETPNRPTDLDYTPSGMASPSQDISLPDTFGEAKNRLSYMGNSLFGNLNGVPGSRGQAGWGHWGEGNNNNNYGRGDPDRSGKKPDDKKPDDKKPTTRDRKKRRPIRWDYPDMLRTPYRVLTYT